MKKAREALGISQRALAKQVGCSHVFIAAVEKGRKLPAASLLERIQAALKIPPDTMLAHVRSRPIQAFSLAGDKKSSPPLTASGNSDNQTEHEKMIGLTLATSMALQSAGYSARPVLPKVADQRRGSLPSVEIDLGRERKAVLKIELKDPTGRGW